MYNCIYWGIHSLIFLFPFNCTCVTHVFNRSCFSFIHFSISSKHVFQSPLAPSVSSSTISEHYEIKTKQFYFGFFYMCVMFHWEMHYWNIYLWYSKTKTNKKTKRSYDVKSNIEWTRMTSLNKFELWLCLCTMLLFLSMRLLRQWR